MIELFDTVEKEALEARYLAKNDVKMMEEKIEQRMVSEESLHQ